MKALVKVQIVSDKALIVSQDLQRDVMDTLAQITSEIIRVNSKVDIYNSESEEILLFDDGIQVKSSNSGFPPRLPNQWKIYRWEKSGINSNGISKITVSA